MKKRMFSLVLCLLLLGVSVSAARAETAAVQLEDDYDCHGNTYCPQFTLFFDDALPYDHWGHAAVDWAIIHEITCGMDLTHFGPFLPCTRGQAVTFLWRAAGSPEPGSTENPFTDVSADYFCCKSVLWAVENGITFGVSADTFAPDQPCSTAHMVTFLYRAVGGGEDGWYGEARDWAEGLGLPDGTGLTVEPDEPCSRAAAVTFLHRALS